MDFIIKLSNKTFPIAYWYLIIGLFCGFLRDYVLFLKDKNLILRGKLYPKVKKIKELNLPKEETDIRLFSLYKENGYTAIVPAILSIIRLFIIPYIIISLLRMKPETLDIYTKTKAFIGIKNIFNKNTSLVFVLLIAIINNLWKIFNIKKNDILQTVISIVISAGIFLLMSRFLSSAILIFMLGQAIERNLFKLFRKDHLSDEDKEILRNFAHSEMSPKEAMQKYYSSISDIVNDGVDKIFEKIDESKSKNKDKKS